MTQLTSLRLAGWKSIRDVETNFRPLNVLIGANGAGKSNLVGFFKMMNEMMGGRFQVHVATIGGAESLLHYGSKQTTAIEAEFRFATDLGPSELDEPELGLHLSALSVLADLVKSAARHSQLLIATQSATLIDHFEAEDIVTVNLRDGCSTFERLDANALKDWLEEYKLSELWERNVIGGGPY